MSQLFVVGFECQFDEVVFHLEARVLNAQHFLFFGNERAGEKDVLREDLEQ